MTDMPWEHAAEARAALNAIITDPEHGVAALSSPRTMSNLLKDLLPDAPREKNLLVAAAEAGLADSLRDHVAQGMDSRTAIRLTATSFSERSPLTPDACSWVTGEIAVALGISDRNEASEPRGAAGQGGSGQGGSWQGDRAGSASGQAASYEPGGGPVAGAAAGAGSAWALPGSAPGSDRGAGWGSAPGSGSGAGWGSAPGSDSGAGWGSAPGSGGGQGFGSAPGTGPSGSAPGSGGGQGSGSAPGTGPSGSVPGFGSGSAPGFGSGSSPGQAYAPPQGYSPGQAYQAATPQGPLQGYGPMPPASRGRGSNTLAVVAFVLGLAQFIGWIIVLVPGLIAAILAIVLGFVSIKQIGRTGESGRGLAIAGIVLGFLGIAIVGILVAAGVAAYNGSN